MGGCGGPGLGSADGIGESGISGSGLTPGALTTGALIAGALGDGAGSSISVTAAMNR